MRDPNEINSAADEYNADNGIKNEKLLGVAYLEFATALFLTTPLFPTYNSSRHHSGLSLLLTLMGKLIVSCSF